MNDSNKEAKEKGGVKAIVSYMDLGLRFAISILIGIGGGYWLDTKFQTLPLFLIIGLLIGATSGFLTIYRAVYSNDSKKAFKNG